MNGILFFDELDLSPALLPETGGKALNLARLRQAGFAVPPGFIISASAFRSFVQANELENLLSAPGNAPEQAQRVSSAFAAASLPLDLSMALTAAYQRLGDGEPDVPVAVRSSAAAEDGAQASFAGQHETLLNVHGEQALLAAVRQVWASLWAAHALVYRARLGMELSQAPALPLVVQRMVPARCAGVAFTLNPVSGQAEVLVEAVPGLADGLVSGHITPDRCTVERDTLALSGYCAAAPDHPVLAADEGVRVAGLALELERFLGAPQDVEWAMAGDQLFVLQSRPITALALPTLLGADGQVDMDALLQRASQAGSEIWTNDNVGEVFPDIVTPLSWSVLEPAGNQAFRSFLRRVGVRRYPPQGLFGRFYGRVYFNQSQFQRILNRFYPSRMKARGRQPGRRAAAALALLETGLRSAFLIPLLLPRAAAWVRQIPPQVQRAPHPASLPEPALWNQIAAWRQTGASLMDLHLTVTIFSALLYALLDKFVRAWSAGAVETAHLTAGLEGMKSAEMGRDLAALAALVAPAEALALQLGPDALPAQHPLHAALQGFLQRHGHTSMQEFELAHPRWSEDPFSVMRLLQAHRVETNPEAGPVSSQESAAGRTSTKQHQVYLAAAARMRQRLGIGPRRLVFEMLLVLVRRYSVARENLKYTFVMSHSHLRALYLALARRLVHSGALPQPDDLFYLEHGELLSLVGQGQRVDMHALVQARRQELESYRRAGPPDRLLEQRRQGSVMPLRTSQGTLAGTASRPAESEMLLGVAASAGEATGRARVIVDLADAAGLQRGEILVTRATNPAWAPLLLSAGALVTEIGGLLSHGAIVAREYGLPAVLNVEGVTGLIHTGQLIQVDGGAGTVRILEA
jgi:rifampicin phosphotransferase